MNNTISNGAWLSSTPCSVTSISAFSPPSSTPILPPTTPSIRATDSTASLPLLPEVASGRCIELALEGERRCRNGDARTGINFLENALAVGTDDLRTLSAIYSQLGNAYFYTGDYIKALEYHRHDLTLARTVGDKVGEAKASGNLGNTLKVLGKFDEAILCCQRHLEISRELEDTIGESRALYNIGNVYHAKGKHIGRMSHSEAGEFPLEVRSCLQEAADYYEQNLAIVQKLGDRSAEGRACGNLGNTYYLLGDFHNAVEYHKKRLTIAQEFGDKPAMRRAYSNLGNAHVFLGEFDPAIHYYQLALSIAVELRDQATEAQACYSLGNSCTLTGEHSQAVNFHIRHLKIARLLKDRVGQARAAWSLGNAFTSLGEHSKAVYFVALHLQLSREIGDQNGENVAEQNLSDLAQILGPSPPVDNSADPEPVDVSEVDVGIQRTRRPTHLDDNRTSVSSSSVTNTYDTKSQENTARLKCMKDASMSTSSSSTSHLRPKVAITPEEGWDEDQFFELLSRAQSKRMDDQRCDPKALLENKENRPRVRATDGIRASVSNSSLATSTSDCSSRSYAFRSMLRRTIQHFSSMKRAHSKSCHISLDEEANSLFEPTTIPIHGTSAREQGPEEFLEMIAGIQGRRMDDQRASLPFLPGLQHPARVLGPLIMKRRQQEAAPVAEGTVNGGEKQLEDDFIDMLIRCQGARIEEQRSELPLKKPQSSVTVPDDDFFQLLVKMQARRFDEQRAPLRREISAAAGKPKTPPSVPTVAGSNVPSAENPPHKRTASQKIKKR